MEAKFKIGQKVTADGLEGIITGIAYDCGRQPYYHMDMVGRTYPELHAEEDINTGTRLRVLSWNDPVDEGVAITEQMNAIMDRNG